MIEKEIERRPPLWVSRDGSVFIAGMIVFLQAREPVGSFPVSF